MPTIVTALQVMIASPSDVSEAREAVYMALARWNEANTANRKVALIASRCMGPTLAPRACVSLRRPARSSHCRITMEPRAGSVSTYR